MKKTFVLILVNSFIIHGFSQLQQNQHDSITQKFYSETHHQLFWFSSGKSIKKASEWLTAIESAGDIGIVTDKTLTRDIRESLLKRNVLDGKYKESADRQITGLVLHFIKEVQQGTINFDYDEVSVNRDSTFIEQLRDMKPRESVASFITRIDCKDPDYLTLKAYLHDSVTEQDTLKYRSVVRAMNYRRYLTINHVPEYILVNIPEATAVYFTNNQPGIKMRTAVGRKKSPTPLISAYLTSIVTFPHWNVPYTIAVNELLPKVQKDERYLEQKNFEIVDAKGNPVDDSDLNWADYDTRNFPYFFRQATGPDNSLGVIKFNLDNPFSIFLHSTSTPGSFSENVRYLTHGCIRLEKPLELADALLRGNIDMEELKSAKKDTESKTLRLPIKIPVYIIYVPLKIEGKQVTFLQDVYGLVKQGG
ncbi:MAG: L,D-transpeptidase family protein [Bacteroidales bacterium]